LTKNNIWITIIDDSNSEKCEAHCGVDWSRAENLAQASRQIKERFSTRIALKYSDLSGATDTLSLEWRKKVSKENLSLPLLVINDKIRISGEFDLRMLLDVIDAQIETRSCR